MYSSSFLVILYGKELSESLTVLSLIELAGVFPKNCNLVIWNNGPNYLSDKDLSKISSKGVSVHFEETIDNISISDIYNKFIHGFPSDRYIILDHDSLLNNDYIDSVFGICCDEVGVPKITSKGIIRSPTVDGHGFSGSEYRSGFIVGIGSGVVFGSDLCVDLVKSFGDVFDSRFYFYGVDTTFFYRINSLKIPEKIKIISGFEHSLSRLEFESDKVKAFRILERSYDAGLTFRYYHNLLDFMVFLFKCSGSFIFKKIRGEREFINPFLLIKSYVNGLHYRNNK